MKETREQRRARRLAHERLRRKIALHPKEGDRALQRYPDGYACQRSIAGPKDRFGFYPVLVTYRAPDGRWESTHLYHYFPALWQGFVRLAHVVGELA